MNWFLIGYPVFILFGALGIISWQFDYTEVDWPAWVQAIGSIGAILVAVWVFWRQAELQRGERKRQKVEEQNNASLQLQLIIIETSNFLGRLKGYIQFLPNYMPFHFDEPGSNDIRHSMNSLSYSQLDQFSMQRVFRLRGLLSDIHIRFASRTGQLNTAPWSDDLAWINGMSNQVNDLLHENNMVLVARDIRQPEVSV